MHNSDCFWKPFGSERVNEPQKLLKSAEKHFYPTFSSFWAKLSWRKLFLTKYEILRLLVNTLPPNYQYSRSNRENYIIINSKEIIWKTIIFLRYFLSIFAIYFKFPMFWNKHERYRSNISEVIESERCAYLNA